MKKTFKAALVLFALLLCFASLAHAEGVGFQWNTDALTEGELSAGLTGAEDGLRAVLALYEGDMLVGLSTKTVENSAAELSVTVKNAENGCAKLMLWSWDKITPMSAVVSVITPEGITPELPKVGELKVSAWVDANGDGIFGEGDQKLPGAAIKLVQGETAVEAVTDENGEYIFEELPEGEYTVGVTDPAGREAIGENPLSVTVSQGEKAEAGFGFKPLPGSISGSVWNDVDGDGKKGEGEEPMPGVTVTAGAFTASTDENGIYKFDKLAPGSYTVSVAVPEGMEASTPGSVELTVEAEKTAVADFGLKAKAALPGAINGVVWNDTNGDGVRDGDETGMSGRTVTLTAGDGKKKTARTATDGTYKFEGLEPGEYTLSVSAPNDREATLENPRTVTVISDDLIIENFGFKRLWVSDDQKQNKADTVAFYAIEEDIKAGYSISFDLILNTKGDNAIILGDSANINPVDGNVSYGTSSVILLFNSDDFSVRDGNGNGGYSGGAVALCTAAAGKTYAVTIDGDISANTYTVTITDEDGNTYTSNELHARKNGAKLDTIALISNSHKTVTQGDVYSDFNFYIKNFLAEEILPEPEDPTYNGFAGQYYAVTVNGLRLRGNNGQISADNVSVTDRSNEFMPRYMGDGSYAFVCMSWERRITAANRGSRLTSSDYNASKMNDLTQHWILEEGPSYTEETPAYYLKSADNGLYIGLSGGYLTSVNESNKVELIFNPLPDEDQSPLYKISRTEAYAMLTSAQRKRIAEIYESVAGDAIGRYGPDDTGYTFRKRFDNTFNKILDSDMSAEEGYEEIYNWFFAAPHNENGTTAGKFVITDGGSGYSLATLPGTEGTKLAQGSGTDGSYKFWTWSEEQKGTAYPITITNTDGTIQELTLYVQDNDTARKNAETFKKAIIKIPSVYRQYIRSVYVREDGANSYNCGSTDMFIRLNWTPDANSMAGTISHELSHSIDQINGSWSQGGGWDKAMKDDMFIVSPYANSTKWEDFAEFGRLYFLCYDNRDRQKAMQIIFPNRYASYWRLRHNNLGGFELWEDTEYLE
ncbi:MAG: carboxypeptidase regulatory-like domain-containing protein [Oscillospiraceae bacterium]|nr:carboxypeptidase regulatory-like domain-containing protein [Oscillospiraceae bacterium]